MQLDINTLITAIEDHTTYTMNLELAARSEGLPHVVWELLSSQPDIAMAGTQNVENVAFRMTVYAQTCEAAETTHKALAGSFDEATLTITGYTTIRCQRTNASLRFVRGTWQATLDYLLWAQED